MNWTETTARPDGKHLILGFGVAYIRGLTVIVIKIKKIRYHWQPVETVSMFDKTSYHKSSQSLHPRDLDPLLLTWFNFNPSMDK